MAKCPVLSTLHEVVSSIPVVDTSSQSVRKSYPPYETLATVIKSLAIRSESNLPLSRLFLYVSKIPLVSSGEGEGGNLVVRGEELMDYFTCLLGSLFYLI